MSKLTPLFSLIFLLLLVNSDSNSQTTFANRIGSANPDFAISCKPTYDNGIILVQEGSTNGMDLYSTLIKTDSNGILEWTKLYQIGQWCLPSSVLQAKDEGFIVYGSASDTTFPNNNNHVVFLYKTDNSGNVQWNKQYAFTANDIGLNIVNREAGGYIGFSAGDYNLGTFPNAIVSEYDQNGDIAWSKQIIPGTFTRIIKGIELPNRNICFIASAGNPLIFGFNDIVTTMLDSSGNLLWSKSFGTYYDDEPNDLTVNSSNEILITGRSYFINREWDSFFLKLDQNGNKLVSKFYDAGTNNGEIMRCIKTKNDGTTILLGDIGTFDERDITMINLNQDGSVTSAISYPFSPYFTNYPYELFIAKDGGIIFTGDYSPPTAYRDAIIVKTESSGKLNCFNTNVAFTEYNDTLTESTYSMSPIAATITTHNFHDSIPFNVINCHIVCPLATDIDKPQSDDKIILNVFPNPANDYLTIETNGNFIDSKIIIYSVDGKKVVEQKLKTNSEKIQIDLHRLSSGIYFLECLFDDRAERIRFEKL